MPRRSASSRSTRARTRYLTYDDVSTIAYQLAEQLFSDWLGPMPVLVVLGGEEGAGRLRGILALPKQTAVDDQRTRGCSRRPLLSSAL